MGGIIFCSVVLYVFQMIVCAFIHNTNHSRDPECIKDAIIMTFLPWVIVKMWTKEGCEALRDKKDEQ